MPGLGLRQRGLPVPSQGVSGSPGLGPGQRGLPVPLPGGPPGGFLDIDAASNAEDTEAGDVEPSELQREPTEPGSVLPDELLGASWEARAGGGAGSPDGGAQGARAGQPDGGAQCEGDEDEWA